MLKRLRKQLFACLLPAVLLFAQQGALAHLASHIGEQPAGPEKSLAHLKLCGKCLSAKTFSDAQASPEFRPVILQAQYFHTSERCAVLRSADIGWTSCRDPPCIL